MKKKMICTLMATVLCLSSGMTAFAAPETMPDGSVFDAEYYAETYPDVKAAFGDNKAALYNHYLQFGKAEGRMAYEFGYTMEMQNTVSTGVKLEASDENYLKAAYIALGGDYEPGEEYEWWGPVCDFERKDYSSDPYYQQLKAWIINIVYQNSDAKNLFVTAPCTYRLETQEQGAKMYSLFKNLTVDLMKEGYCKNITIYNTPIEEDGVLCANPYGHYFEQTCEINSSRASEQVIAKHPELQGYFKQ